MMDFREGMKGLFVESDSTSHPLYHSIDFSNTSLAH